MAIPFTKLISKPNAERLALPVLVANARRYLHYSPSVRRLLSVFATVYLADCDHVGASPRAVSRPRVDNRGRIEIGDGLFLRGRWGRVTFQSGPEGTLTLGDDVEINYGTLLSAQSRVTIGNRVMIGNCCTVADAEVPQTGDTQVGSPPEPIEIGDDAWLAVRVTVLPGAKIGAGSVITAGSVVSGVIPPGVVAGGIPARVIRTVATSAEREKAAVATHVELEQRAPSNGAAASVAAAVKREIGYRGTLVSDFTIAELADRLHSLDESPGLHVEISPFGQVVQALMDTPPTDGSDFAVVWTQPASAIASFARLLGGEPVPEKDLLAEVDEFSRVVERGADGYRFVFVPTWTHPAYDRGLGLLDCREGGVSRALAAMNLRLMDNLAKRANVHVLGAQRWIERAGKSAYAPKPWYLGKVPFDGEVFAEAAREIHGAIRALTGLSRKLLVLDLDDTMWGGIVGDVGWENLRLGGHDSLGESFVDFQRAVKALTRRGIILGIVSKNEDATAMDAIRNHPEMVLREDDFVGRRINWRDKAQNIADLVAELNLGLQSVVFIDDNPVERARVREALPEVFVPEWPEDKLLYKSALQSLRCFDVAAISKEDAERTQLYASERKRDELQRQVGSIDEWLLGLGITVRAEPLAQHNRPRATQLLNKTNQMNLSTRRFTEDELFAWAHEPNRRLWAVTVGDKFGDAGLTGIVSVETAGGTVKVVDFILSCRVMGRKIEDTLLHLAVEHARAQGAEKVVVEYLPTSKNKPCLSFLQGSRFASEDDTTFVWNASEAYPLPAAIQLEWQR